MGAHTCCVPMTVRNAQRAFFANALALNVAGQAVHVTLGADVWHPLKGLAVNTHLGIRPHPLGALPPFT